MTAYLQELPSPLTLLCPPVKLLCHKLSPTLTTSLLPRLTLNHLVQTLRHLKEAPSTHAAKLSRVCPPTVQQSWSALVDHGLSGGLQKQQLPSLSLRNRRQGKRTAGMRSRRWLRYIWNLLKNSEAEKKKAKKAALRIFEESDPPLSG